MRYKVCARLILAGMLAMANMLGGCSVNKAASNAGVDLQDIQDCTTRGCFLCRGMDVMNGYESADGSYVEVYRAMRRKSGANYLRATGYAVAGVMTLGLSEAIATPAESAMHNNRGYILVHAIYPSRDAEEAQEIRFYDHRGQRIYFGGATADATEGATPEAGATAVKATDTAASPSQDARTPKEAA